MNTKIKVQLKLVEQAVYLAFKARRLCFCENDVTSSRVGWATMNEQYVMAIDQSRVKDRENKCYVGVELAREAHFNYT